MIGRDPITIHYTVDGEGAEQTVYGTVVTEQPAGELAPFSGGLVFKNFYRLILPASLDMAAVGGHGMVTFGTLTRRLDSAITAHYSHGGRLHHYEAIVSGE